MANLLYPTFKEALLNQECDLSADAMVATLIDGADYTYGAAHQTYATDVPAGAKVAASPTLTSPTIAVGVFDTADFVWSSVTGDVSENIILWDDDHASDQLAAFFDTGMSGMPVTPNSGDINVTVNASGWFAL